jgi:hypothetical protein
LSESGLGDYPIIIAASEIDTRVNARRNEWGDSSDLYRDAFENERIEKNREPDYVSFEVVNPKPALMLAGLGLSLIYDIIKAHGLR